MMLSTEPAALEKATLENGTEVSCIRAFQVKEIERQVAGYLTHGISVQPGDTVFDVGANIGLFTLLVHEVCAKDVDVYAFEPIPETFSALAANLGRANPSRLRAFPCGLSHTSGSARFLFTPNMATLSSLYGEDDGELRDQVTEALSRNIALTPPHLRWLRFLPRSLREYLLAKTTRSMFEQHAVTSSLRTLSEIVHEEQVQRIDLLKIDVEKSELDVLAGIEAPHWGLIQQVVIEVHDLEGRLEAIVALLRAHGLTSAVEQDIFLRGSNIYNIYARRA